MIARPDTIDLTLESLHKQMRLRLQTLARHEAGLWSKPLTAQRVADYQQAFRDYENFIAQSQTDDGRAHFIVTIPVADRPHQLKHCLQSLLTLCEKFQYGGMNSSVYNKIDVLIADDSSRPEHIRQNRQLCEHFTQAGLRTDYFGIDEQAEQLDQLSAAQRSSLESVIGKIPHTPDVHNFSHKGASIMRNIAYLRLHSLTRQIDNALIYFIDSDQEFCINLATEDGDDNVYAINYFHHLDQIFSSSEVDVLTGKVVGDPPVSPAVMANRFLEDIEQFLDDAGKLSADASCAFHAIHHHIDNASYHDMADMFGFDNDGDQERYHCTLRGEHTNRQCMQDFARKLNHFFHGAHPTRSTHFNYAGDLNTVTPARTVYTGNYVLRPQALQHHIAFADLHLRMAGPTLGRIMQATIGQRFVSANLPMLHHRTISQTGKSEFRPDVQQEDAIVDLTGEFERQYFGDLMLFTIEALTKQGFPEQDISSEQILATLMAIEKSIHKQYEDKHQKILQRAEAVRQSISALMPGWCDQSGEQSVEQHFAHFIDNIQRNYGERSVAYQLINSDETKQRWTGRLLAEIERYKEYDTIWQSLFR